MEYNKIPVSVSNQTALWKKAKKEFANMSASNDDFLAFMSGDDSAYAMYTTPPATDSDFLAYMEM